MKTAILQHLTNFNILNLNGTINIGLNSKLKKNPAIIQMIIESTQFLRYDASINCRIHCLLQNIIEQPTCQECNKILKMRTSGKFRNTFPTFCSPSCAALSQTTQEKKKQTNIERYGSSNVLSSSYGKEKRNITIETKYNVKNVTLIPNIKERKIQTILQKYGSIKNYIEQSNQKRRNTNIKKYGTSNPFNLFEKKRKTTNIKRYGVENVFSLHEMQLLAKKRMEQNYGVEYALQSNQFKEKFHNTMKEKYGVNHALQYQEFIKKFKATMLEKYGVEHALQKHYTTEIINNLNNVDWLTSQHVQLEKTLSKIAKELNVAYSIVGRYFKKYQLDVLTRSTSQIERDLLEFIHTIYDKEIQCNVRNIIAPYELDIFVPDKKIAFEVNGIFWHSELNGKDKKYHLNKTTMCSEQNIRLVHIWDKEWMDKEEIVKSRIKSFLGCNSTIPARKCKVVVLTTNEAHAFFNANHIQGNYHGTIRLGLVYQNQLVAAMSFNKSRFNKKIDYELIRYSNIINSTIIGGASKLFNHFTRMYSPTSIITYSDKRWNTGQMYKQLGFTFNSSSKPNYFYFKPTENNQLLSRQTFQKHKLSTKLQIFDENLTEWENMKKNGYDRIWDCGNDVWIWTC